MPAKRSKNQNTEQQLHSLRRLYWQIYQQYGRATTEKARQTQWDNLTRLREIAFKIKRGEQWRTH